ncbi:MAG: DUF4369 domain-containing protein, partial [Bacteroidales bacterium]|nr:DUF4369 domain-containing protein [Bacteroidales bacterium]
MKIIVLLVFAVLLNINAFAQKTGKNDSAVLTVNIQNNTFSQVSLINAYGKDRVTYATADIKNDAFTMKLDLPGDIYRFDFGSENYMLVVVKPGEKINMTIDADDLQSVVSVSGSPSMDFVKEATSFTLLKKVVLDSLNEALQNDPQQKYWGRQAQTINQYTQTNADIDRYLLSAFDNMDTLKALMEKYVSNGKIKGSNLDYFVAAANKTLKDFDRNYRPFANYLENVDSYYNFTEKQMPQYPEYYTLRSNYIMEVNARYDRAKRSLGTHMEEITKLIAERDSLVYNNLFDKGKNKVTWAMQVVNKFAPIVDEIAKEHQAWHRQLDVNQDLPTNLVEQAQSIVKNIVGSYQSQYNENDIYLNNKVKDLIREHKSDVAVLMFLDMYPREQ